MYTHTNNKLISYSPRYYLFGKGAKLLIADSFTGKQIPISTLLVGTAKSILGSCRLMARALRLEVRCGIFVDETTALVSYHGAIYRVDCEAKTITLEHEYRREMNNPLCFTKIEGVEGFSDGIYYGEYFLNHEKAPVSIYKRENDGWKVVYTFPAGSIYHIHGIIPCPARSSVFILTGDKDEESGIYEFKNDFSEVTVVVSGKQQYRSCIALPTLDGMLYTTDTPLETNYLYHLDFATKETKPLMEIAGPCIYGKVISENEMLFSTSVEPDSNITGLRYEFTHKLGPGVKDRYTHLYSVKVGATGIHAEEIFKAKKDILPMGAGQFGTLMFPAGEGDIYVTGQAINAFDNKTIKIR